MAAARTSCLPSARLIAPRACTWADVSSGGEMIMATSVTGDPSLDLKSMGRSVQPMAATTFFSDGQRPCGTASPSPIPVVRCCSRSHTAAVVPSASCTWPCSWSSSTSSRMAPWGSFASRGWRIQSSWISDLSSIIPKTLRYGRNVKETNGNAGSGEG